MTTAFTAVTIAIMLLAVNIIVIANAQQQQQQPPQQQTQLQSTSDSGGLTAAINSDSFTTGETITISGSVAQLGSSSNVVIEITDPQGQLVKRGFPALSATDNTFTYSFVAGEQEQFDTNAPMVASGNYLVKVRYFPPSDGIVIEEVELSFGYNASTTNTPAGSVEPEARTTPVTTTTSQQAPIQNVTTITPSSDATTVRSTMDSFRVQVPQGWAIHDVKNTGFTLAAEVLEGLGILAQLCPDEGQQQQTARNNAGANTSNSNDSNSNSCQGAQGEVIHIIRYPNIGARLGILSDEDAFTFINNRDTIPNAILAYHMQKLEEAGYQDLKIVTSTDTTVNVDNSTTRLTNNRMATTIPAKIVEITYSTNFDPNETKRGYFILTATAATPRNLGVMTGYSAFYEDNSPAEETTSSGRLTPTSTFLPPLVRQVFDSFELLAASTEPLRVEISTEDAEGIAPATFEFEADVTGGMEPYTIRWDFGDGITDEENDDGVEHTFDIADTYRVSVLVTDSTGRTASDSILITVEPPPPLTAVEIIPSDTEGIAPATFEFEANVTGGTEPYTYSWDFGDGSVEIDVDDETMEHTFDIAGTYNVDLTVIDSTGRNVSDSISITVEEPPPLTAVEIIPSDTEGIAPATFEFEANVTGGTEPYTYSWDFGDGSVEIDVDDETMEHTFDIAGTYNVDLTVIDSTGQSASDSILITVEPPPTPPASTPPASTTGPTFSEPPIIEEPE
jgi:PKD repeat protein